MGNMLPDVRVPSRKSRVRGVLGRVGRWTLVVVVLGLALIGFLHLTRGTAVRHVRGVSSDGTPIAVGDPEFPLMATMATGPIRGCGKTCGRRSSRLRFSCTTAPRAGWPTRSVRF